MKRNTGLVFLAVATLALGAAGCASRTAPDGAPKPRRVDRPSIDPMAPLDNPAVSAAPCRNQRAIC